MKRLAPLLPCFLVLALWELAARLLWIDPRFFPAPTEVIVNLGRDLFGESARLPHHLAASLTRLFAGGAIGILGGLILAVAAQLNRGVRAFFDPLVSALYPVPKLAIYPLLLLMFGIGDAPKVAMIALGVFFLVFFSTLHGGDRLRQRGFLDLAQVYRVPTATRIFRILLLGSLPEILEGIKTGLGYGLVMMVASEFTLAHDGIGVYMWMGWDQFRILDVYGGLFVLALLGMANFYSLEFLKRRCRA